MVNTIVEDEHEDDYKNEQFNTYRTQLERQKRQNGGRFRTTPEDEKQPGYIWNNLSSGKEKKKWKELDPDSRRKICAGLSPEAPSDPSFQVASTTVAIHEIHAALHDF